MKRLMKWIIPLLLVILLIGGSIWYVSVYDRDTVRDFLCAHAQSLAKDGNVEAATRLYKLSYRFSGEDADVAIELAESYRKAGNYTKAEHTLANAIADGATAELYAALCQTYVEQDKLLDAVNMLDNITDPEIKAQLDAMRPAAPAADYESGYYSQYITLTFTSGDGTLYVSADGEYPSTAQDASEGSLSLTAGETKVYALAVSEDGLVSPLSIYNYTIGGVVEAVTLNDAAIEAAIRDILGVGADTVLYTNNLWTITEFTVPAKAADLSDLGYLIYLESLTINKLTVNTLDFLSGMTALKELRLTGCRISADVSAIGALPNLQKLTLSDCGLTSISGLSGSQSLLQLDLSGNIISNLSPLSEMTMLQAVDLSENAVTDLSALSGLTQLTSLNLAGNAVASVAPLASCANLTTLDVSNNTLTSLSGIGTLTKLEKLYASYNAISDVSSLSTCTSLLELDLAHNNLTDISGLSSLTKLVVLDFSYNAVTSLPKLPTDCALATLKADYNQLTGISVLSGMDSLNYVYLDYNQITDISGLTKCHALVQVNVYGNTVSESAVNKLLNMSVIVNYDPTMAT